MSDGTPKLQDITVVQSKACEIVFRLTDNLIRLQSYLCASFLAITGLFKVIYLIKPGLQVIDPLLGISQSVVLPSVGVVELVLAVSLLIQPMAVISLTLQFSLLGTFVIYRIFYYLVLGYDEPCACGGYTFAQHPMMQLTIKVLLYTFLTTSFFSLASKHSAPVQS